MNALNETHDPALRSWVESANDGGTDFPIQNLPFGIFRRRGSDEPFRGGVAIGDQILDLAAVTEPGVFRGRSPPRRAPAAGPTLNALMQLGGPAWSQLRGALSAALAHGSEDAAALRGCLVPQAEAEYALPARDRRLHRLLRLDPSCLGRRPPAAAGAAAAAELPVGAARLPLAQFLGRACRASAFTARGPGAAQGRGPAGVRAELAPGL